MADIGLSLSRPSSEPFSVPIGGVAPIFDISRLFTVDTGPLYDISIERSVRVGRPGTDAFHTVARVTDPVGAVLDVGSGGYHAAAPSDDARPVLSVDASGRRFLLGDGRDDRLVTRPFLSNSAHLYLGVAIGFDSYSGPSPVSNIFGFVIGANWLSIGARTDGSLRQIGPLIRVDGNVLGASRLNVSSSTKNAFSISLLRDKTNFRTAFNTTELVQSDVIGDDTSEDKFSLTIDLSVTPTRFYQGMAYVNADARNRSFAFERYLRRAL